MALFTSTLNELRNIIFSRKSEVSVERISVCNVFRKSEEHDIQCLPCSIRISS